MNITSENGMLVFVTPYDREMVNDFKSRVPSAARRWDQGRKAWYVLPKYGNVLVDLVDEYFHEEATLPTVIQAATPVDRQFDVRYIGACRDRADGTVSAYGYTVTSGWNVIFPEVVLQAFFNAKPTTGRRATLYATLGITANDGPDVLQSAYRRLAMQWHPDRCKEPDASQRFQEIKAAYDTLRNPDLRARYNAGLALEATLPTRAESYAKEWDGVGAYRPPLRCGIILANGLYAGGTFNVAKVLKWDDITRNGKTLIVSWNRERETYDELWV
jgi:hypothetical protein